MTPLLVDSNILLDIFEDDAQWADWSETTLAHYATSHTPTINPIIYAEVSIGFARIEDLEAALAGCGIQILAIPKEALFLAGKAFLTYKRRGGTKPLSPARLFHRCACGGEQLLAADPGCGALSLLFSWRSADYADDAYERMTGRYPGRSPPPGNGVVPA